MYQTIAALEYFVLYGLAMEGLYSTNRRTILSSMSSFSIQIFSKRRRRHFPRGESRQFVFTSSLNQNTNPHLAS